MFTRKSLCWLAFSALLVPLAALPDTGRPEETNIELPDFGDSSGSLVSPELERRLGETLLRQVRRQTFVIDDPELQGYLQSLGYRLVSNSNDVTNKFTFFLIRDPAINAFAAPGGYIGVHSGIFLNAHSESEVAAVLAHEISHVTQKHMARAYEKAKQLSLPMAAAMIGAILLGTQNPQAGAAAISAVQAGSAQAQINFTRGNEEEADRIGMQLLQGSGFDPRAMPAFFERLQQANRYYDEARVPEFLRTHPVTVSRIADARNRAERFPLKAFGDSTAYQLMKARLRALYGDPPERVVREFEQTLRQGTFASEPATRYGYALALIQMREFDKARQQLDKLIESDPERVTYQLALARLDMAAGNVGKAMTQFERGMRLYPDYPPLILSYAEALILSKRPGQARALLRNYANGHDAQPVFYRMLALAEGRSGAQIESHMAMSDFYYHNGDTRRAIQILRIALNSSGVNHYQRGRMEDRLKELEYEWNEERKITRS